MTGHAPRSGRDVSGAGRRCRQITGRAPARRGGRRRSRRSSSSGHGAVPGVRLRQPPRELIARRRIRSVDAPRFSRRHDGALDPRRAHRDEVACSTAIPRTTRWPVSASRSSTSPSSCSRTSTSCARSCGSPSRPPRRRGPPTATRARYRLVRRCPCAGPRPPQCKGDPPPRTRHPRRLRYRGARPAHRRRGAQPPGRSRAHARLCAHRRSRRSRPTAAPLAPSAHDVSDARGPAVPRFALVSCAHAFA